MTLDFLLFLNTITIGVVFGFVQDVFYLLKKLFNNLIVSNTIDFIVCFASSVGVFVCAQKMFFGVFSVFEIVGLLCGFALEKTTCEKFVAKTEDMLYNKLKFGAAKLKNAIKTKLSSKRRSKNVSIHD